MKVGVDFAKLTWTGGDAALGATAAETIQIADEAGFSTIAAMDHFFQIPMVGAVDEPMVDGYTFLGFAAGLTQRAKLQLIVTGVTYRHPGLLAKIVTTLDVLSGGRANLGIGAAWYEDEHLGLGVPFPSVSERFERLDETLQICRQMWSDDDGPFEGTHYQLARTLNRPQCLSSPHPEIMIGGMGPKKTLRLAARYADAVNWFPIGKEGFEALGRTFAEHCETEGTDPDRVRRTALSFPPDTSDDSAVSKWLVDQEMYASLGVDEIYLAPPSADPRADVEAWAKVLLPRLAEI
ncbi:MAG TPA: LLM class F420-dependent oxidoreductase [Microthrixaceae bacterium]|nr:LLM class F420-dependent oxidoreductase [Microthrixaceae bacterium]